MQKKINENFQVKFVVKQNNSDKSLSKIRKKKNEFFNVQSWKKDTLN